MHPQLKDYINIYQELNQINLSCLVKKSIARFMIDEIERYRKGIPENNYQGDKEYLKEIDLDKLKKFL